MAALRVVLDTNVLLSGIAYPASIPGKIMVAWRHGSVDAVLSRFILDELRRVLPRLAHRHGLSPKDIEDLTDILSIQTELVEPASVTEANLRDMADQPVLGTLVASKADYLISGDGDLLALANHYPIITPAEFWTRHGV